jgi:hypothetical protein
MVSQRPLIFMHFHGVSFGSQHEMWSKQHNGKASHTLESRRDSYYTSDSCSVSFQPVAQYRVASNATTIEGGFVEATRQNLG